MKKNITTKIYKHDIKHGKSIWNIWWENPGSHASQKKKSLMQPSCHELIWTSSIGIWRSEIMFKIMYCNKYTYLQTITREWESAMTKKSTMAVFIRTLALWVVPYCLFWIACSFPRWISRFFWFLSQILKLTNYARQGIRTPRCAEIQRNSRATDVKISER